jgi:hypothetical protein
LHQRPVDFLDKGYVKHIIRSVVLANTLPTRNETSSIEMLVGNGYYFEFILCQAMKLNPGLSKVCNE